MAESFSILQKIKQVIIGKSFDDLAEINKTLKKLSKVSVTKNTATYSELLRSLAAKPSNGKSNNSYKDVEQFVKELGISENGLQGIEGSRLQRYNTYDALIGKITYLKRALRIFTHAILSPDDIDKISLDVTAISGIAEDENVVISEVNRVIEKFDYEDNLQQIVYNSLKYGDFFVEIVPTDEILKSSNIIGESFIISPKLKLLLEDASKNRKAKYSANDLFYQFHDPRTVIRIGDKFCLGYFIFPDLLNTKQSDISNVLNQSNEISKKLLSKIKANKNNIIKSQSELKEVIAKLIINTTGDQSQIVARYVPPDLMVHFTPFMSEYKPYGTSIFFGQEFLAKIIIAQQSSLMVQRLMNAMEKRVIKIELGVTRDAKTVLQQFKETLRRKKYTVDSIGNIDEIPSNIATFEDLYIPTLNGRDLINIDTLPARGDIGTHVEDLKFLRDSLVAGLEIPPAFLGLEENVESKSLLSQENIIFATSVVNYQKQFSKSITDLAKKTLKLISTIDVESFKINLKSPQMILSQNKSEYFNSMVDLIQKLATIGIPQNLLINKFLPEFNTKEVKEAKIEDNLQQATENKSGEKQQGGGGIM